MFTTRDTKLIKYYHQDNDYYVKWIPYWKICFFQYKLYDNEFKFEKIFYFKKNLIVVRDLLPYKYLMNLKDFIWYNLGTFSSWSRKVMIKICLQGLCIHTKSFEYELSQDRVFFSNILLFSYEIIEFYSPWM